MRKSTDLAEKLYKKQYTTNNFSPWIDNRPRALTHKRLQTLADNSPRSKELAKTGAVILKKSQSTSFLNNPPESLKTSGGDDPDPPYWEKFKKMFPIIWKDFINSNMSLGGVLKYNYEKYDFGGVYFDDPFKDLDKIGKTAKETAWDPISKKLKPYNWLLYSAAAVPALIMIIKSKKQENYNALAALGLIGDIKLKWLSWGDKPFSAAIKPEISNLKNVAQNDLFNYNLSGKKTYHLHDLKKKANLNVTIPLTFKYQPKGTENEFAAKLYGSKFTVFGREPSDSYNFLDTFGYYAPLKLEALPKLFSIHKTMMENMEKSPEITKFFTQYGADLTFKNSISEFVAKGKIINGTEINYKSMGLGYKLKTPFDYDKEFKFEVGGNYSVLQPGPGSSPVYPKGSGYDISLLLQVSNKKRNSQVGIKGSYSSSEVLWEPGEKKNTRNIEVTVFGNWRGFAIKGEAKVHNFDEKNNEINISIGLPLGRIFGRVFNKQKIIE
ncbi:MAG: hypothetical protein JXJ04_17270 [Spirochaetales bacterium]|nr:hypothetical protein [Spirochaetales bacterium]